MPDETERQDERRVLVLNAGSSSLKFALYGEGALLRLKGQVSGLLEAPKLELSHAGAPKKTRRLSDRAMAMDNALGAAFDALDEAGQLGHVAAVGHRIVHGGTRYRDPARLDEAALSYLKSLNPLAPLHQPFNLEIVEASVARLPEAVQIGAFDTAFHADRPRVETLYGLPRALLDERLVSYGFHGLSFQSIAAALRARFGEQAGGRSIVLHLGSGSSLCAMREGRSVATTMGFSPLDGPVMATRCGRIDPGILLHLMNERGMSGGEIQTLLYEKSGLLGVSGLSGDMRTLLRSRDAHAKEAVDLFVHSVSRQIGSLAASLQGLDTLVFTAGVGENAPEIRSRIARAAGWLGAKIDEARNEAGETDIAAPDSNLAVLVVATDEEAAIAEGVFALL